MTLLLLAACTPPPPDADSLFAAALAASGGEDATRAHHTEIIRGLLTLTDQGITANTVECLRAPGDEFSVFEYPGLGRFESGVLDGVVWANDPVAGPRVKDGPERLQAIRSADFFAAADWKEHYPTRETVGPTKQGDRDAWEVVTTTADGKEVHHVFDAGTHLEIGMSSTMVTESGPQPAHTRFSHWVTYDGVLTPTKVDDQTGPSTTVFQIESITYDPPDFPTMTLPAEIEALVADGKNP
jgi:hypothetical protein